MMKPAHLPLSASTSLRRHQLCVHPSVSETGSEQSQLQLIITP